VTKGGDGIQIDGGGFVRVHHEILEVLATAPLRGQQFRCLLFLLRATYGFNRKEARISLEEWAVGTGMKRQNVWRELQSLMKCNVIYAKSNGPKRSQTWGFNKYYERWRLESVITDDYKSVITGDDSSVITDDYRDEKSVITDDYKSVITVHESKDKDIKTTTTTTEGGGGSSFLSLQQDPVLRCWAENIDPELTPILIADLESSVAIHGINEVLNAIATAVRADNKTMRYVKGVLNRRREVTNGHYANGNGTHTREVLTPIGADNE
jgi:phage replication O-like protein O